MDTDAQLSERDCSPDPDKGPEEQSRSSRGSWTASRAVRAGVIAAACVTAVLLLSAFVAQPFLIPSGSMENTLRPGDRVLVNKLAYRFGDEPRRGDVIVFDGTGSFVEEGSSGNPVTGLLRKAAAAVGLARPAASDYVKRVVGVGGDRVRCCDKHGRIEVNGQPVDEDHLFPGDAPSRVPFDTVVPEGKLWVMGDHRSRSSDSRDHLGSPGGGSVPVDKVIGRAEWVVWPLGRWKKIGRPGVYARVPEPGGAHG